MIPITATLALREDEIDEEFVRSTGPGGQNVNKVATAVQLRFDVAHSPSLPEDVRQRLLALAGRRVTAEGILLISARRFRTQERNRQDARERLVELIRRAAEPPKVRRPTRPSQAAKARRLDEKRRQGTRKALRGPVAPEE
jgi:ribosome-associated protein